MKKNTYRGMTVVELVISFGVLLLVLALATALFKQYKEIQMPNLGLSRTDIADVIEYIEAQTAALNAAAKTSPAK